MLTQNDMEAYHRVQMFLKSMGLDFDRVLKLKNAVESQNKKAVALVLPQPVLMGMKIEFSDKVLNPSIRWE